MSTPRYILDAVVSTASSFAGEALSQGMAIIVSDRFFPQDVQGKTQLGAMLMPRDEAFAAIEKHEVSRGSVSSECLATLRKTPQDRVPLIWYVGEHSGGMVYEPSWSVS